MSNSSFNATRHIDRIIKVCGMADPDNIASVSRLTPMLMGFIFYPPSPRYAGNLEPSVVKSLPDYIWPVGVFVNSDFDTIMATCTRYGIKVVQLHGNESVDLCRQLKAAGMTVLKVFPITGSSVDWRTIAPYEDVADLYLFDTKCDTHGGSGRKFDWNILDNYPFQTPYLLSGGVGPNDIDALLAAMRPKMAGIDINSRFETSPGVKDLSLLLNFIISLRKHNEDESIAIPFWTKKQ